MESNRHEISDSNAWTALTDVPPKVLHWPLCTGWTLGWCRTLPVPVSIQSYGCCPVVVDQCLMLSQTQCNHSPAWSKRWPGTASEVCLCLLPTSNEQPTRWVWEPPCTLSSAHWCASWMRGANPTTAEGTFFDSSTDSMTLHLWAANLKPFLVPIPAWHLLTAVNAYGVQGAPTKPDCQVINKECSEDVPGNTRRQLINLLSKTFHSQDITSWNTFLWVEFVRECCPNSDSHSAVPKIFWHN